MPLDRTFATLTATALLAVSMAMCRPTDGTSGMAPGELWARKYLWPPKFDLVFAGDSRVAEGIAPSAIQEVLPRRRAGNFGFGFTGFDRAYLEAAASKLDPEAEDPTLVLGISAITITGRAHHPGYSGWHEVHALQPHQRFWQALSAGWFYPFRRIGTRRLREAWKGQEEQGTMVFHTDGWMASTPVPERPEHARDVYPAFFHKNPVDPKSVAAVLAATRDWSARGVRVVAVRMPIPAWMQELERELVGIDFAELRRRFVAAGGIWLPTELEAYHSYDGSHLRADAAERFSRDLARALASLPGFRRNAP